MTIFSFYIFDRHAECIYTRRWAAPQTALTSTTSTSTTKPTRPTSNTSITSTSTPAPTTRKPLSQSDDAKLIFGLVFSLRNMVTKLGGPDDTFLSYRTAEYKLHYYETPTRMKFVMLTDTKQNNLRVALHQIWATLYVEYVVKNPLSPVEHPGGVGVGNELFERGLDAFVTAVLPS